MSICGACLHDYDLSRQSQVCPHPKRERPTQVSRLIAYVRSHPGCTGLEIVTALAMPKYTSRVSDARDQGVDIYVEPRADGRPGYHIREPRPVTAGEQTRLAL